MANVSIEERRTYATTYMLVPETAPTLNAMPTEDVRFKEGNDPDRYPYELEQCPNGWIVRYPDLPGCIAHGTTRAEAMTNGEKAIPIWIQAHAEHNIPLPEEYLRFKGNLRIRVPREIHRNIAEAAAAEKISFNRAVEKILMEELGQLQNTPDAPFNGEWVQRMSPATHHALRFEADRQGVSLNMLIVSLISQACGRRGSGADPDYTAGKAA